MSKKGREKEIKLFLSEQEHDAIRLAAAVKRGSMSRFCRVVALAEAARVTSEIKGIADETQAGSYIQKLDFKS